MSNVITTFPYTYNITTAAGNTPVPLFPGAYIFRLMTGPNNGLIPIYTSISDFTSNGMAEILNDRDAQVLVLPGFTLNLYADTVYASTVYPYDNSGGTDVLYRISTGANTATSCRLFYKFPSGNVEVGKYILSTTANTTSSVTYGGVTYRLYLFQDGTRTFSITNNITNASPLPIQALLIGGGGGGGQYSGGSNGSGGGGAGTFLTTSFTARLGDTFTVTVGAGGAGAAANLNTAGSAGSPTFITRTVNSVIDASLNAGGGGGGGGFSAGNGTIGTIYGSTGGGCGLAARTASNAAGIAYTVTSGSTVFTNIIAAAFAGGSGAIMDAGGGGGGGAGAVGGNATGTNSYTGGAGGAGKTWNVNGVTYAGGGGGRKAALGGTSGAGGTGGGGGASTAGTVNTGSGGGAGNGAAAAGSGGSGICIFAIPLQLIA